MLDYDPLSHEREALIGTNVRWLLSDPIKEAVQKAGSYATLLSGGGDISKPPAGQQAIPDAEILEALGLYEECSIKHDSPAHTLRTTRGFNDLIDRETPKGFPTSYKYYLSMDLTNSSQVDLGSEFYHEVVTRAVDKDVVLASKYWTQHAYDALFLYTLTEEHHQKVGAILEDVYPSYTQRGLFYDTPHFFQGRVGHDIPEGHIGYVQEPFVGNRSHSIRMRDLGERIDVITPGRLSTPTFSQAAKEVGIQPHRPYLLAR